MSKKHTENTGIFWKKLRKSIEKCEKLLYNIYNNTANAVLTDNFTKINEEAILCTFAKKTAWR